MTCPVFALSGEGRRSAQLPRLLVHTDLLYGRCPIAADPTSLTPANDICQSRVGRGRGSGTLSMRRSRHLKLIDGIVSAPITHASSVRKLSATRHSHLAVSGLHSSMRRSHLMQSTSVLPACTPCAARAWPAATKTTAASLPPPCRPRVTDTARPRSPCRSTARERGTRLSFLPAGRDHRVLDHLLDRLLARRGRTCAIDNLVDARQDGRQPRVVAQELVPVVGEVGTLLAQVGIGELLGFELGERLAQLLADIGELLLELGDSVVRLGEPLGERRPGQCG